MKARLGASLLVLAALVLAALAFGSASTSAGTAFTGIQRITGSTARPDLALAKLDPELARRASARAGTARVEILASRPAAARAAVKRLGGTVRGSFRDLIEARVPARSLSALAHQSSIRFVRPPVRGVPDDTPGEEVQASGADVAHQNGFTGKGTKVAIIDESFAGLAARQAAGDLPTNVVTQDFCGGSFGEGEGHGTAVAEIVHEMAPDAQLYLICFDDLFSLLDAEDFVKTHGVQIVNFSIEYYNVGRGTNDSSDPVDAIVADARANGVLWVNSAGNDATTHWAGNFVDANADGYMDWAPGDQANTFAAPPNTTFCGLLKWDEWPIATSDFNLALLDSTGQVIAESTGVQNGTQPPTERLCFPNNSSSRATFAWAIHGVHVTTNPRLDLYTIETSSLKYQTAAGSIGDPASSPSAFAVGAVCWQTNALEFYSSQGPTIDGRTKPDIAGHDSVSSGTFGPFTTCPSAFAGTSASSPEVAGAAALVKQANPRFTPAQIQTFLEQNAVDVAPAGPDDQTGAGTLRLPSNLVVPDTTPPSALALGGKGVRGHVVKLLVRVFDDSGRVRLREQVKQNGRVIKTLTTGFFSTPKLTNRSFGWSAGRRITGTITHCVRAQDQAGNVSPVSCARVSLTG